MFSRVVVLAAVKGINEHHRQDSHANNKQATDQGSLPAKFLNGPIRNTAAQDHF